MINIDSNFNEVYEELSNINPQEDLQESNKIVRNFADSSWYSGSFSGLNDISDVITPEERERKLRAEEERKREKERVEFEKAAKKAIDQNRVPFYNYNHKYDIREKEHCPAIDLETNEFVYDPARKKEIIEASKVIVDQKRKAVAAKGLQTKAANKAAQPKPANYYTWTAYYTINGKTSTVLNKVLGNTAPESSCLATRQMAVDAIKQEMKECKAFKEPFRWDGQLTITVSASNATTDKIYKRYKFNTTKA